MDMRSSNPALPSTTFSSMRGTVDRSEGMTVQGTVIKTFLLLMVALMAAGWTWMKFYQAGGNGAVATPWVVIGALGGFVVAIVTVFKKTWAPVTAPLYALLEGLFIGGISAQLETAYPGIVIQAVTLTFGTLFAMLFAYQSGLIKVTENFKLGVIAATGGIALVYLVTFALSFFGIQSTFMYGSSLLSIGISLFIVVIAALNFVLDFDFIEQGARQNVPKYMEWYGAFALMVTLVWLYIEFLRLLSKMRQR
jgi:uncharacterized YccA/Bax inhibitor family protein